MTEKSTDDDNDDCNDDYDSSYGDLDDHPVLKILNIYCFDMWYLSCV